MIILGSDNRNLFRKPGGQLFDFDPSVNPPTPDEYGKFGRWLDRSKHARVMSSEDADLGGGGDRHWRMDADTVDSEGNYDGVHTDTSWGEVRNEGIYGLTFAKDRHIDVPSTVFDTISNEITIVAYVYGTANWPDGGSLFWGDNGVDNNRIMQAHLPWTNNYTYIDLGNDGSSFDRINKYMGTVDTYRRSIIRWVFTKNVITGIMKIYKDGVLWHSGTGKTRDMSDVNDFVIGNNWAGTLLDFRVYDRELSVNEAYYLQGDNKHTQVYPEMDFSTITSLVYEYSQETGVENVLGNGIGIEHVGGLRRTYDFGVSGNDITVHTYLEFDFESTVEGELHAIGYDDKLTDTWSQLFQLFGTTVSNAHQDFNDYQISDGVKHYKLPLGQIAGYDGNEDRLVIITDDTLNLAVSRITNVRIYNEVRANPLNIEADFVVTPPSPVSDQDGTGTVTVIDAQTLKLEGNKWQSIPIDYIVTANTRLEFDFQSSIQKEIHGVGVWVNANESGQAAKTFQVYGTQTGAGENQDYNDYPGSGIIKHYSIPIGTYFTGQHNYLVFAMDDDATSAGESIFSNVRLVEPQLLPDDLTDPSLRLWYQLNETSGVVVNDASAYGNDGILTVGGLSGKGIDFSTEVLFNLGGSQDSTPDYITDLLLQLRMDKNEHSKVTDVTGNDRDGIYVNDPTWVTHAIGGALAFDGNDTLDIAYAPPLTEYGISLWFKTTSNGGLFCVRAGVVDTDRDIYIDASGNVITMLWAAAGTHVLVSTGVDYRDGGWHHVVCTMGTSIGGRHMYIDKTLVASDSFTASEFTWATKIQLGYSQWVDTHLDGECRDCRIYNRTLSQANVDSIYNATNSEYMKILDDGSAIKITGNSWKGVAFPYVITPNTVLEFDFASAIRGEQHSIYFANSPGDNGSGRRLQVYGTQTGDAILAYHDYPGGGVVKHYTIPVGEHYTGTFAYLAFQMDDDASPNDGESIFSNVSVYESDSNPEYTPGRLGSAIKLTGANQIKCGDGIYLTGVGLTWIFDIKTSGREQVICQRGGSIRGYTFYVDAAGYLTIHMRTGQFTNTVTTNEYVADGVWHTIGISATDWYVYVMVDGKWGTESNTYREFNGNPGNDAFIGGDPTVVASNASWEGHMFIGEIDNFRIFSKYMNIWELCARMKIATIESNGIKLPNEAYQPIEGIGNQFLTHGTIMAAIQMPVSGNGFDHSILMATDPNTTTLRLQQLVTNKLGFTMAGVGDWSVTQAASNGELLVVSWTSNPGDNLIHIGKNDLARESMDVGTDYQLPVGILARGPAGFTVRRLCGWSNPMDEATARYYRKKIMEQIGI